MLSTQTKNPSWRILSLHSEQMMSPGRRDMKELIRTLGGKMVAVLDPSILMKKPGFAQPLHSDLAHARRMLKDASVLNMIAGLEGKLQTRTLIILTPMRSMYKVSEVRVWPTWGLLFSRYWILSPVVLKRIVAHSIPQPGLFCFLPLFILRAMAPRGRKPGPPSFRKSIPCCRSSQRCSIVLLGLCSHSR